jgi:prevent-host-death family protein
MSLKVVTALKARQKFGTIMNAVSFKNDQYIVERKGIPMVAIIPIKKFKQMDKARQRFFSNMSKISDSFAGEDLEKLDDILAEATQAAKQIERHFFCQRPDQAEFKSRQTPNPLMSLRSRTADTILT